MTPSQQLTTLLSWVATNVPHNGLRQGIFRKIGIVIGDQTVINYGVNFLIPMPGKKVQKGTIKIGNRVAIATGVVIVGESGPNFSVLSKLYPEDRRPITICDDVWIGANAVILPGVTIGEQSIVAAGSVVTKDVPPCCIVAGAPARKVKDLPKLDLEL